LFRCGLDQTARRSSRIACSILRRSTGTTPRSPAYGALSRAVQRVGLATGNASQSAANKERTVSTGITTTRSPKGEGGNHNADRSSVLIVDGMRHDAARADDVRSGQATPQRIRHQGCADPLSLIGRVDCQTKTACDQPSSGAPFWCATHKIRVYAMSHSSNAATRKMKDMSPIANAGAIPACAATAVECAGEPCRAHDRITSS